MTVPSRVGVVDVDVLFMCDSDIRVQRMVSFLVVMSANWKRLSSAVPAYLLVLKWREP